MRILKKVTRYVFVTLIIFLLATPLWIKAVPTKYISRMTGKVALVDRVVCDFSTTVVGKSMNPLITPGSAVKMSRCFENEDVIEGVVVLFHDGANLRFGIIRHVLPLSPIVYKVSDEKAPELLHDVILEDIAGITKDIDVRKSSYQPKQDAESFVLDSDEFLTDFYLAKIPKGAGIETSTVEKTTLFSRQKDKFCSVVVPKKNLTAVEIEIINTKTQEAISLGKNIIYDMSSKPTNIGCRDFGFGQGMLNIPSGTYRYVFLMNHQVLAEIQFEVR
ncbi:MAG: hypothetical protein UX04_C0001G0162 [Microgenomates group bacterium GW2011_GWF2_45_18]|nr:MAG: hypothetical protein UW18_C0003G0068 [Microgenomates group bacterium GW2011_GWF1_44_10]KKU02391.1 MAG: hypothetical protein UX04_C0001G0162 [Microgenomates group bacterium GW2011_GWF2_45_18]OGJ41719.1 MAG: hypothetical protein A2378_02465 [Candidatus Pacebacteria bacterium RIFOXYB1_FULL_44_10]HAU99142.1 hypothetical protein [Candidatus Paceibacterota bacterium]HAX01672.1 hypothetical protein [Candidatus Paceibacterota bacterium]